MLALRVTINDEKTVIAGAEDLSVLSAIVSLAGKLGKKARDRGRGKPDMHLHVGGLTARGKRRKDEHLRWTPHLKLKIGDGVAIELIKTTKTNRPVERTPAEIRDERSYFKYLKKQYLELKTKYEPES
jgi:hypothetical protein